jgi:hypothetical protein
MLQQQQQAEMEMQQRQLQLEQEKLEREDRNRQLDREKDIQVATIKALGFSSEPDVNSNNQPDVMEQQKVATADMKAAYDLLLKNKQINNQDRQHGDKMAMEKYKADVQKEIAVENENKWDQDD